VALGRRAARAVRQRGRNGLADRRRLLLLQRRRRRVVALLDRGRGHRLVVHGDPAALLVKRATVKVALEPVVVGGGRGRLVHHRRRQHPVVGGLQLSAGRAVRPRRPVAAGRVVVRRRRRYELRALGRVHVYGRRVHGAAALLGQPTPLRLMLLIVLRLTCRTRRAVKRQATAMLGYCNTPNGHLYVLFIFKLKTVIYRF